MTYESKPPSIGLWRSTSDRGPHASGNCGNIRFVLWLNEKHSDNAPDYRLVLEAPQRREDKPREDHGAPAGGAMPDDEIPF